MTHVRDDAGGRSPGAALSELLRGWWEAAGEPGGRGRPTQQALAVRLRIDQTTLSRYLNPRHPSIAPLRIVEALHAHLGAPADELERARELCRAALENQRGQRAGETTPTAGEGGTAAEGRTEDDSGRERASASASRRTTMKLLGLVATVVCAFLAGLGVARLAGEPAETTDAKAAGTRTPRPEPSWLLVYRMPGDQLWRSRTVQYLLRHHGYDVPVDGRFDARTEAAVKALQRREHLPQDGKVGRKTWPLLVVELRVGDKGDAVMALQSLLDNVGQGGTAVTGTFGHDTLEDLRHFQQVHGLRPTGVADVDTWRYLMAFQEPPMRSTPLYTAPGGVPFP
ncbi:peptidoglycan-binding protein [Streptomyces thermoalcalitolerans]|uniref:Peptidoglycan binding-like domain-containing protein n=1 Tax=Streptomyces thermoalcalitolerans TaxID=65605 RepID=A0ABN1ND45_9ACTN